MANSLDPDQCAPSEQSDLPDLYVRVVRIITVLPYMAFPFLSSLILVLQQLFRCKGHRTIFLHTYGYHDVYFLKGKVLSCFR